MAFIPDQPLSRRERRRAVIAVTIGNGLEFYDFVTFAFFAIQIGHTFFPSNSSYLSLMGSLATFGAGFITRPIGAHILGGYADRAGRKPAMLISMSLMGCGILLLALTPGYATIGIAAPLLALTARLMQGFALGGEIGSATAYMLEAAAEERRGLNVSLQVVSQQAAATVGAIVGLALSALLSKSQLDAFGWRIALALGASIVPFALMIRRDLPETHQPQTGDHAGFASYRQVLAAGFVVIGSGTIATYIFNYMATFGQNTLHLSPAISFGGETSSNLFGLIMAPIGGWLSDRYGRRLVMIVAQLVCLGTIVPCFLWLTAFPGAVSFIGANALLSLAATAQFIAAYTAISESLPPAVRARAFALVYSIPVALFGGTTQLVITWLLHVTGKAMAIPWYLTGVTFIGLLAMFAFRESAPAVLRARGLVLQA